MTSNASDSDVRQAVEAQCDPCVILAAVRGEAGDVVDLRCTCINRAARARIGRRSDQLIGRTLIEDGAFALYAKLIDTGERLVADGVAAAAPGAPGSEPSVLDLRIARHGDEWAIGIRAATERDAARESRRDTAERDLARTAALLADGEEVAGFGTWSWEARGDLVSWSKGLCHVLGLKETQRDGWEALGPVLGPDSVAMLRDERSEITRALRRGTDTPLEIALDAAGTNRVLALAARPVFSPDDQLLRVVGTAQDVTARVRTERELREARDILAEAERSATTLAEQRSMLVAEALDAEDRERNLLSEALHDDTLQVLLAAQQDLTEALAGDRESLIRARAHVEHAQSRLRDLLADLSPAVAEFSSLSAAIANVVHQRTGGEPLALQLDLDPAVTTPHDRLLIRAAGELLANVVAHARATSVRVSLTHVADTVDLCVEDDGTGFTPDLGAAVQRGHIGLASLTSRATGVGGDLRLGAGTNGEGARACIRVPAA